MDKYRIMADLFLSNPKMRGWHPEMVYETIKEMGERGHFPIGPKPKKEFFKTPSLLNKIVRRLPWIR